MNTAINPIQIDNELIEKEYLDYINAKEFACIAAKAALAKEQISCFVADHIACPHNDVDILEFLYDFIDKYRASDEMYHSAAVIFKGPAFTNDEQFDDLLWQKLQTLSNIDARQYKNDERVSADPNSPDFSFSLKEESFFIIGLHPGSTRETRRFKYPTLVFNPHMQFEQLRASGKYDNMKYAVRKRDIAVSGEINPMLKDFGESSEVYQYSGRQYDQAWKCPFINNHKK